ncbi:MAG TPA: outer membrane beta-barrel protein [Pyrinomonadaceae bacterium]|nr:outer membrane beta-barrel protein [Pyrinomonadaceae bacterium]
MLSVIIASAALPTFAQTDYNRAEGAILFSHNRVDTGISDEDEDIDDIIDEREGFNGFNASATGNLSRYVGLKADYAFHRKSFDETVGGFDIDVNSDLHNFVGGVQFKDNSKETKVKPFGHLMAGVAHARFSVNGAPAGFDFTESETGLAGVFGGGIDIRVSENIDFRAVQFDYNPTRLGDATQHNFRIGIGIVFH